MVTKYIHDSNRKTAAIIYIVCYSYRYMDDVCLSEEITTQEIIFCHLMAQLPQVEQDLESRQAYRGLLICLDCAVVVLLCTDSID
jgi:hypothetical protein